MNVHEIIILFTAFVLLAGGAAYIMYNTFTSVQPPETPVIGVMEVVDAVSDVNGTVIVVTGLGGKVPLKHGRIYVDGSVYEYNYTFVRDLGDKNYLNKGDIAYIYLPPLRPGIWEMELLGSVRVSLGEVAVKGKRYTAVFEVSGLNHPDYQVKLVVPYTGRDCSDIRVYAGGVPVPFFVERCGNPSSVWIRVPVPSKVFVYWGYTEGMTGTSDPNNVFLFYADFTKGPLSGWTATDPTGVEFNGCLIVRRGSYYPLNPVIPDNLNTLTEVNIRYLEFASPQYAGVMEANSNATLGANAGGHKLAYLMTNTGNSSTIYLWAADGTGTGYTLASGVLVSPISVNVDYIFSFYYSDTNIYASVDASTVVTSGSWRDATYLWFGMYAGANSGTTDGDDICVYWARIRNYVGVEASATLVSVEEETVEP